MFDRGTAPKIDGRRATVPLTAWRGGRLTAPDQLLVLLAGTDSESDDLRRAWVGQAVDVESCADLAVALLRTGQLGPDLIVIGPAAGPIGPREFLTALRRVDSETPVIVGLDDITPLPAGLAATDATAVMARPFDPGAVLQVLAARHPSGSFQIKPLPIDLGRLRVDGTATRIWVDSVESLIPAMEFVLLRYLAERHGQIVSRDELVSVAWGGRVISSSNTLAVHVARLRRRFHQNSGQDWIRSVRGCGYQLVVPPTVPRRRAEMGS